MELLAAYHVETAMLRDRVNRRIAGVAPTQRVAIVIPTHRGDLTAAEHVVFGNCLATLGRFPVHLVVPEGVAVQSSVSSLVTRVDRLASGYFVDFASHQRMCLSPAFYTLFADYEYILMHHLDAFVFRDELERWCDKGFAWVGAPFVDNAGTRWAAQRSSLGRRLAARVGIHSGVRVGNGGFSLRSVPALLAALKVLGPIARRFQGNEDVFWSFTASGYIPGFSIPDVQEAQDFSVEVDPAKWVAANGRLPFGCHAWDRYGQDFWRAQFYTLGIDLLGAGTGA